MLRQSGLGLLSSTDFTKVGFTWAHHLPLSTRWNFSYGTHNIWTLGKYVPWFEKSVVGIRRSEFPGVGYNLRGYERYAIDGSFVNMTKAELKYAVFPIRTITISEIPWERFRSFPLGVYLSAYFDAGYVRDETFSNEDNYLKNQLLGGYGIGLNIIGFYDNLLRIEYSRNHLNEGGFYFHATIPIK